MRYRIIQIGDDDIDFRTNDKNLKVRRLSDDWPAMPRISESLRLQLTDYYRDDVAHLQAMTGRNLEHWLQRP